MKLKISNEKIKRLLIMKHEVERNSLRFIIRNELFPFNIRMLGQMTLNALPRQSSEHFYRRRCVLTGSPKVVIKEFNINRHIFRKMGLEGRLPGVIRAKW